MSSPEMTGVPATPPPLSGSNEKAAVPVVQEVPISIPQSSEQMRDVIRLIQCPICSLPLQDPITLPCGKSLCKKCLPDPHLRTNISYPATENRLQGLQCPFSDCCKDHAVGDCSPDVTLNKAVSVLISELRKTLEQASGSELVTHITAKDEWEAAGVPSLQSSDQPSEVAHGGKLLATFALVDKGELRYGAEVTSTTPITKEHDDFDAAVLEQVKEATRPEMDCHVCYALFLDPVTTPCGHTYCRSCLQRVMDHAKICPVCRRELTIQPIVYKRACPSNQLLDKIAVSFWPDILDSRRRALVSEGLPSDDGEFNLPIFVCTLSFPSMPTFLHIFEPRYRLMIRRALENDRCFGMTLHHNGGSTECGTVLRIVNVEFFPDGRSLIETVGASRFRILRSDVLDGYMVAQTVTINDISIAEEEELEADETRTNGNSGSPNSPPARDSSGTDPSDGPKTRHDLEPMATKDLMDFAAEFVVRMRQQSVGWLAARILHIYGECPRDPAHFPWWFANVLPVRDMEKYRLLNTTSVRQRLKICCGWILEWENSRW
ncbi:ATP-dependent protease La domain-containing protein [Thozetella sp. PMI_491]|nr:ATP-dependent protease La domain-containing protein [Thozetella sp. PMI_491]